MREMKDSGIEWIGKIPKEWGIVKFKYLHNGLNTGEAIDKEYWESDAGPNAFYTAGLTPIRTGYSNFPTWKETGENDLLLARNGTPYVYLPVSKAYYTDHIIRAAMSRHVNRRFIRYCLQQSIASIVVDSVSIPTWSATLWNNQILTWPSAIEQERIAAFLDAECAEIDAVLEKTRASIEEYKKLKQAVITQAVTKGIRGDRPMKDSGIEWIGDIPAEWDVIRVKQLLKERNERSKEGKEEPLSMSQKVGLVPTKFLESIPNMASSFVGAKLAYVDDLVFNKLKAHLGVFSVSRYDGLVSPDYAVYCSTGKSNLKYLEYIFKTPQCIGEFRKKSTGIAAGLMRLYTEGLFSIYLPYPALSEQEEIAEYLNEKCAGIDALIAKKQQYLTEIENYKKSLIYEYVTGKKEVV